MRYNANHTRSWACLHPVTSVCPQEEGARINPVNSLKCICLAFFVNWVNFFLNFSNIFVYLLSMLLLYSRLRSLTKSYIFKEGNALKLWVIVVEHRMPWQWAIRPPALFCWAVVGILVWFGVAVFQRILYRVVCTRHASGWQGSMHFATFLWGLVDVYGSWHGSAYLVWFGSFWLNMVWYDLVEHGMVWFG